MGLGLSSFCELRELQLNLFRVVRSQVWKRLRLAQRQSDPEGAAARRELEGALLVRLLSLPCATPRAYC